MINFGKTLSKVFFENGETYILTANVRFNDECKNGYREFSVTGEMYRKNRNGRRVWEAGGCLHDEIAKHIPELKPFITLHLCNIQGLPMYAIENGYYYAQKDRQALKSYFDLSDEETETLAQVEDKNEFKVLLYSLGIIARRQRMAEAVIQQMEEERGEKLATYPGEEKHLLTLSAEEEAEYNTKKASGYYRPEQVAARKAAREAAVKAAKIDRVITYYRDRAEEARREKDLKVFLLSNDVDIENIMYYTSSDKLQFNWMRNESPMPEAEIDRVKRLLQDSKEFNTIEFK